MFDISLQQGSSVAWMLVVTAAAILLTAGFYWRAFRAVAPRQWWMLLALRVSAILLVVLLLFRPVLSHTKNTEKRPSLIFLVDHSASMAIADDATGATRWDQSRRQVQAWWDALDDRFDLHVVAFAERARPLDNVGQLAEMAPDGAGTSLSRAMASAAGLLPRRDVEAVVLFSDGVHNSARNPLEVAAKMGVKVDAVGVGASLRSDASYRDLQVTAIDCPDRMMLDNRAEITGLVEGVNLSGRVIQVFLEEDGQRIAQAELALDGDVGPQPVGFDFRPTVKGRHVYTIRAEAVGDERIEQNNQRSAVALVVEPGIRVLYVEGTLRAEYGALVDRFLAKDPDLQFCALVQTRPNVFLKRSNMPELEMDGIPDDAESIDRFDVFILGDLDASYLRPEQQQRLVARVRAGAGLVMLGGYHSLGPGGYGGTPLGEILPVRLGDRQVGQMTDPFLPRLTPEGVRHPIFANVADFFPTGSASAKIAGLPPLSGCTRVEAALPVATVLATLPDDAAPMPVLAVRPVDRGRTAVFCGDTTRQWQQGPRAEDRQSPFLRFWGQMVRWLAGHDAAVEAAAGIVASADKAYYEPEQSVRISAVVRDSRGEGARDARVVATVEGPNGRSEDVPLTAEPAAGNYSAPFEPASVGTYRITLKARLGEELLEGEPISVEVGRPNLEYERLDLDDHLLGQIASQTGGRYVHLTTADDLVERFDDALRSRRDYRQYPLYWPPGFWLLFVALLTTEWILRRRFQLR